MKRIALLIVLFVVSISTVFAEGERLSEVFLGPGAVYSLETEDFGGDFFARFAFWDDFNPGASGFTPLTFEFFLTLRKSNVLFSGRLSGFDTALGAFGFMANSGTFTDSDDRYFDMYSTALTYNPFARYVGWDGFTFYGGYMYYKSFIGCEYYSPYAGVGYEIRTSSFGKAQTYVICTPYAGVVTNLEEEYLDAGVRLDWYILQRLKISGTYRYTDVPNFGEFQRAEIGLSYSIFWW